MRIVLYDVENRVTLYPMNVCRSSAELVCGILSVEERWKEFFKDNNVIIETTPWLQKKYGSIEPKDNDIWVMSNWLLNEEAMKEILSLKKGEYLTKDGQIIASKLHPATNDLQLKGQARVLASGMADCLEYPWHIFQFCSRWIEEDARFLRYKRNWKEIRLDQYGNIQFLIEEGADLTNATINWDNGLVYIGRKALVMEGSTIRGPVSLGHYSVLKMGTRIYGGTSIASNSVAGGEVKNAVLQPYSNKAHDGYLGDSVVGHWCNIGAATNSSNVRNDAGPIPLSHPYWKEKKWVEKKCGLIMGDYCRTGIQSILNTGLIVDTGSSILGGCIISRYMPPFRKGTSTDNVKISWASFIQSVRNWMQMKSIVLKEAEEQILRYVYEQVEKGLYEK